MDHEPEVTPEQMDETRASLTEKLETLENRVLHTVEGTAVAVHDTVVDVKEAVHETVGEVKEMFDLPLQVRRRPWLFVGGSIALGYLGGRLLLRNDSNLRPVNRKRPAASSGQRQTNGRHNGVIKESRFQNAPSTNAPPEEVAQSPTNPGVLSGVTSRFEPENSKLEELAIGTALSAVRDLITESLPEQLKAEVAGVMDSVTVKLGGEPVPGPVFQMKNEE